MGDDVYLSDQQLEGYREAFQDMQWPEMTRRHSSWFWDEISRRERVDWIRIIQNWQTNELRRQWEEEMGRLNWDRQTWPVAQKEKDRKWKEHLRGLHDNHTRFLRLPSSLSAGHKGHPEEWAIWERHLRELQRSKRQVKSVSANASSAWSLGGTYPHFGWIVIAVMVILGIFLLLNLR